MSRILPCPNCQRITLFIRVEIEAYGSPGFRCTNCLVSIQTGQSTLTGVVSDD